VASEVAEKGEQKAKKKEITVRYEHTLDVDRIDVQPGLAKPIR
jgi:hypothetical protein